MPTPTLLTRLRRPQSGQSLIEFALVTPLLLLLILGLVTAFQMLLANYTVGQAARAAAHQAAIAGGDSAPATAAGRLVLDAGIGTAADRATLAVSCAHSPCRRYDPVTVRVVYSDHYWAPIFPGMRRFTVSAETTRAAERDRQ